VSRLNNPLTDLQALWVHTSMLNTSAGCEQRRPAGPVDRGQAAQGLRPRQVLGLSTWCGLFAGLLEVGIIVLRKRVFDLNKFYWMSRHFVWLIPLTDVLILLACGTILAGMVWRWPAHGKWLATRLLCSLALLAPLWAALPGLYGVAGLILVMGIATRIVPVLERHGDKTERLVTVSFPLLAAGASLLGAAVWASDKRAACVEDGRPMPAAGSPNVLLIVLDTVAAGHMSLHGYDRPTSTTLDALARRGIRFDRAQSTSSWTLPSHSSLFTGHWPHELSAGWLTPLNGTRPTLADYLGSQGYATAGFVANTFYCATDSGLGRGFTHYQDYFFSELLAFKMAALIRRPLDGLRSIDRFLVGRISIHIFHDILRKLDAADRKPAAQVTGEFVDWLSSRRQPQRPFFAFLNYYDAHYPYQVPDGSIHRFGRYPRTEHELNLIENWRTMPEGSLSPSEIGFARDCYDDCIADLDEQLGRLFDDLERLGVMDRTWLVITADHGESFGEQPGVFRHGTSVYQPQLHVPLLFVPPSNAMARRVVTQRVSLRDIPATIVDLLNLKEGAPFPGSSLARFWRPTLSATLADIQGPDPVLSEVVPTDPLDSDPAHMLDHRRAWASLARGDLIYIHREGINQDEIYNLHADPHQAHNLAADPAMKTELERMRTILDQMTVGTLTRDRFSL
jgi:arylsulfatase A-like enzyme